MTHLILGLPIVRDTRNLGGCVVEEYGGGSKEDIKIIVDYVGRLSNILFEA
jgi:hypothetical protein